MTTLLVLGGADGSIGTIDAARRLGIRTLCVDRRTDAPGVTRADEYLSLSTLDIDAVAHALAGRRDVAGVMSPASDVNLPAQYELAHRLGLPNGLSDDAVRASVDKGFFRDVCARVGLPNPGYVQGPLEHVLVACDGLDRPVMVKPSDSSGGRGVARCDHPDQLPAACVEAAGWSGSGTVIVEEYVEGADLGAEAIIEDGRVAMLAVGSRVLTEPPSYVTTQTYVPLPDGRLWVEIRNAIDALCAELGYRWGSLNADLVARPDGTVVFVEIGARLGGNGSIELLGLANGIDANEIAVSLAIGRTPDLRPRLLHHAAFRVLGAATEGKLLAIDGVEAARAVPGVAQIVVAAQPGDHVVPYTKAGAKLGYLLASAETEAAVVEALDRAEARLEIEIANPELDPDLGPALGRGEP